MSFEDPDIRRRSAQPSQRGTHRSDESSLRAGARVREYSVEGEDGPRISRAVRRARDPKVVRIAIAGAAVAGVLLAGWLIVGAVRAQAPEKKAVSAAPAKRAVSKSGPTQVFAQVGKAGIAMHFPAAPDDMIAVGFHQAYNVKAFAFEPTMQMLPIYKPPAVTKAKLAADPSIKLFEEALRYRGSSPRSAADCAVKPDSRILSPVTGTVTLLKHYKLEGHIDDLQLEIKPDGAPLLRVVMIHIRDAKVKVGDRVVGGVTPVATVRHLTLDSAVNRYLPVSPADHTHIQVNDQRYRLPSS